jgi:hypothetical protein
MKKAVIITGTEVKGCTFHIKEAFCEEIYRHKTCRKIIENPTYVFCHKTDT